MPPRRSRGDVELSAGLREFKVKSGLECGSADNLETGCNPSGVSVKRAKPPC